MKLAAKTIFLFRDPEGFGPAIFNTLQLNPNFHVKKEEIQFELPLDKYGITDVTARGQLVHFVDHNDSYQVSVLLVQNYEPPVVACVVNEILTSITEDNSSTTPTLILPYFVPASKLHTETINPTVGDRKVSLYSSQIGPATDFSVAIVEGTQQLPPSLQIQYEPLACLLHLVRVLKLPTILLVGSRGRSQSKQSKEEVHETFHEMVEFLAGNAGLCFTIDGVHLNLTEKAKISQEPWRALYG